MAIYDLSDKLVSSLQPGQKTMIHYDQSLKGFGIRVTPKGHKAWIVEYRPGVGGRGVAPKRMTIGQIGIVKAKQAREQAKSILSKARLGEDPASAKETTRLMPTVAQFSETFLADHVQEKLAPSTFVLYKSHFVNLINPLIGSMKISDVTSYDIDKLHKKIARTGEGGKRRNGAANKVLITLGSMFRFARLKFQGKIIHNPVSGIEKFKSDFKAKYLTADELKRLNETMVEAVEKGIPWNIDPRKKTKHIPKTDQMTKIPKSSCDIIRLLILTGARKNEVLKLRWDQVNFTRGILEVDAKGGPREIILNEYAITILRSLPEVSEYVFPGQIPGQPRFDLAKPWDAIRRHSGIKMRLHDLRHTHASFGLSVGLGLPMIGGLLGHSSPATTSRYAHLITDPARAGSGLIADSLTAAMEGTRAHQLKSKACSRW